MNVDGVNEIAIALVYVLDHLMHKLNFRWSFFVHSCKCAILNLAMHPARKMSQCNRTTIAIYTNNSRSK